MLGACGAGEGARDGGSGGDWTSGCGGDWYGARVGAAGGWAEAWVMKAMRRASRNEVDAMFGEEMGCCVEGEGEMEVYLLRQLSSLIWTIRWDRL